MSVSIPDSVTSIGYSAFEDCSNLTGINIPDSVTSIGYSAFEDCSNLTGIDIPDSVTSIGDWTFKGCSNLTSITLPGSVTCIGEGAFEDCSNLTSVNIPDGVTSIGDCAFWGCSNLTNITLPGSVTCIGEGAFAECSNLTSINIPDSVTSIGDWTFEDCSNLTSITIPDSITRIRYSAFEGCTGLKSSTFKRYDTTYSCIYADGIMAFVMSQKALNQMTVYKAKLFEGIDSGELLLEDCVIAEQDGVFAHGETLKKAMSDLQFKQAKNRGADQYRELSMDAQVSFEDAVTMYRVITGACEFGTEQFIKTFGGHTKIKESYSPREIIKITRSQYNHDVFAEFFS